jgi:hypothetical protein
MSENTFLSEVTHLSWRGGIVLALLIAAIFFSRRIKTFPRDLIFTISALLSSLFGIVTSTQLYKAGVNQTILTVLGLWVIAKAMQKQRLLPFSRVYPKWAQTSNASPVKWKKCVILLLLLGAISAIFAGMAIGSAFFSVGLLLLLLRPFPLRKSFAEEFPLPFLLETFSAYIFFFAIQSSGLSQWVASSLQGWGLPALLLLFFSFAQLASHGMPRPLAFAIPFSVALALFTERPVPLFLSGITMALAAAVPLFRISKSADRTCN